MVHTQNLGYISKSVGQEFDTYDEVLLAYMRKNDRGQVRPAKGEDGTSIRVAASTQHIEGTKGVWRPNDFSLTLLQNTKPLLDRTHTPRGALRSITLDRNFAREKWLYNKKDMDLFDPTKSKRDLERSKTLKRIQRKQEKQRTLRETQMSSRSSLLNSGRNTSKISAQ